MATVAAWPITGGQTSNGGHANLHGGRECFSTLTVGLAGSLETVSAQSRPLQKDCEGTHSRCPGTKTKTGEKESKDEAAPEEWNNITQECQLSYIA